MAKVKINWPPMSMKAEGEDPGRTEEAAEEQKRWQKISGDRTCHDQIQPNFRPYINE